VARPADRYVSVRHVAALKTFEQAIVQRPATAPGAPTAVETCWTAYRDAGASGSATWSPSQWLPGLGATPAAAPSPAEHIAAQLAEFDAALLHASARAPTRG
jgi:hypothetical protein